MLGALETKKLVFPRKLLVGDEVGMENGATDAKVLENSNAGERSGWLQGCSQCPRKGGLEA
jgi:hypothetical protein